MIDNVLWLFLFFFESKNNIMYKRTIEEMPKLDMTKLKPVRIDEKTIIYVPLDRSPEDARARYWSHRKGKNEELKR